MENTQDDQRGDSFAALPGSATLIVPPPQWQEEPEKITEGDMAGVWAGRYQKLVMTRSGYPDVDVDVDFAVPPSDDVRPKQVDGVWWWVSPND